MATRSKSKGCKLSASLAAMVVAPTRRKALGDTLTLALRSLQPSAEQTYHVLVRCKDGAPKSIAGVPLVWGSGDVATAIVPASKLMRFAGSPDVERVSAPRRMKPLDIAVPLAGVPKFIKQNKVSGKGVVLGIVDTGIDLTHPAFAGRVLKIWDQEIAGQGPGPGYSALGKVLTGAAMTASEDTEGHGTHVAGICGGQGDPYTGIATGADYLICKTNFENSAIVEGVRWIFAEAKKLGRPCVVNLSLGGHFDGHDGKDDMSVAISDECGPGQLVVAAAGNEGGDPIHVNQLVNARSPASFDIKVNARSEKEPAPYLLFNGWYSGKGVCEVRVTGPNGDATKWQGLIADDPGATKYTVGSDSVTIASPNALAPNGDRQFVIEVAGNNNGPVLGGTWKLEVRRKSGTPGQLHVWLLLDPSAPNSGRFADPTFSYLIGSPGSATDVVTAASYTCRNEWNDLAGEHETVGLVLNTVSEFSSPGPLRNGRPKPDVTAPGAMIASCLASAAQADQRFVIAKRYQLMAGTSMATPFVAGLLALQLELKPRLTPAQAKAWLKSHSKIPGSAAGKHDVKWGYGLIKI
ncbi:S8 family serine peptidase [Pseudoduganella sp. RAF19]|uniref:S8 family serine peptidase n=2 Tax=unclassified Pseudoduganella TaxID=2637179 RepID=UPI003F95ACE4